MLWGFLWGFLGSERTETHWYERTEPPGLFTSVVDRENAEQLAKVCEALVRFEGGPPNVISV